MNTRKITVTLVTLTLLVMATSSLFNDTNELQPNGIVEFSHEGGIANGTAILGGILTWEDDAWNATWDCDGGLSLVYQTDWDDFVASGDNDPHNYTSWGIELTGAGSYYTENAPEGEWIVTAGLSCTDDAGVLRSAGGQFGDVHDNPPYVSLLNDTTVGGVDFTLIEHGEGPPSAEQLLEMFDTDESGDLSLQEIIDGINSIKSDEGEAPLSSEEEVWFEDAVNESDADGDGLLDINELEYFIDLMDEGGDGPTFICGDGEEIPFDWVNDGTVDCTDGADEQQYDADGNEINWFDCQDGSEVWIHQVNDGNDDCPDGEDEAGSDSPDADEVMEMVDADGDGYLSLQEILDYVNEESYDENGENISQEEQDMIADGFADSDGDGDGLLDINELEFFIDLMEDMDDGGDDGPTFVCGNGDEIPFDWVNDGDLDCEDGADEQQYDVDGNEINWFDCHDGSEVWIHQVNDGNDDCPDGEDEAGDDMSLEELMEMLDADGDGYLSLQEMLDYFNEIENEESGVNMSQEDEDMLSGAFADSDSDGDGLLDINELQTFDDFLDNMDDGGDDRPDCDGLMEISFQQNADGTADLNFVNTCTFDSDDSADMISKMDSDGDGVLSTAEITVAQDEMNTEQTCYAEDGTEVPCGDDDSGLVSYDGVVMETQPNMGDNSMQFISVDSGIVTVSSAEIITVSSDASLYSHLFEYDAGALWDGGNEECSGGVDITATSPWSVSDVTFLPATDWASAMNADGTGWSVQNTDGDGDGHCNSQPSYAAITFTTLEDGSGDDDGPDCENGMEISFQQNADGTANLTFTATCSFDAVGSSDMISNLDSDGDGVLSTAEIAAAQDEMNTEQTCYAEDGTEVPCGDDGDDGLFSYDGVVMVTQPVMGDDSMTLSAELGIVTMSSTEVITVSSDASLYSHLLEYDAGALWDGGNDECSGDVIIKSISPWSVSNVSFEPTSDWVSAMYADGTGWHVDNFDADGDGHCNSQPSYVAITFTTPEPEPVVDTAPTCEIYYNVGGVVLTANSTWSLQIQGAVSFEVPSDGDFTLALPVGEYSVILACNDAEGDAIVVSGTNGDETWGGTAQDGMIYSEGLFTITDSNVSESVDITLTWSSTEFNGTFNTHFTAVESVTDALDVTDTGALPGFTSMISITAMLGAALILARRKD